MRSKVTRDWPEGQRPCYTCGYMKGFSEFGKHKDCALGLDSVCKACRRSKSVKEYRQSSLEYRLWYRAKRRAKVEELPFNIEVSDIVIPDVCPVLGTDFMVGNTHTAASLDKVVPSLGYTKGNVRVISNRANRLKNDATLDELERIVAYVRQHRLA